MPGREPEEGVKVRIRRYWDWRSRSYRADASAAVAAWWETLLEKLLSGTPGGRALDVGTGRGQMAVYLARLGWEVTGVDLSFPMLRFAREAARRQGLPIHFQPGDAERLPFGEAAFQVVVSRNLLWTLPHPGQALREWRRVLAPGGRLIVSDGMWRNPTWKRLPHLLSRVLRRNGGVSVRFFLSYAPLQDRLPLYEGVNVVSAEQLLRSAGFREVQTVELARRSVPPYPGNGTSRTPGKPAFFVLVARR